MRRKGSVRYMVAGSGVAALAAVGLVAATAGGSVAARPGAAVTTATKASTVSTSTPIKHVVVIFDENVSYDHYFATYPKAANTGGTKFTAKSGTPWNDNLANADLINQNPNEYTPKRLTPQEALTCDQNHNYGPEQQAYDSGAMDLFVQKVSTDTCTGEYGAPGLSMDYYDGNTVTAEWNYAQRFAMSDRNFDSTYGPSTPGALNLVSGQTHGFIEVNPTTGAQVPTPGGYAVISPNAQGVGTVINDPDPAYDDCADTNHTSSNTLAEAQPGQKNIGDLLNAKKVTWGWFQGGFAPTTTAAKSGTGYAVCGATHTNVGGTSVVDYSAHHDPFEYYKSTSNPHHLPPTSIANIGKTDQANHQYDLTYFSKALADGHLPSVSFLKAGEYQDGHAGYSDPIDEQHFLVKEINAIQASKYWKNTAVIVTYDDSDGWYDHAYPTVTNASQDAGHDAAACTSSQAVTRGGYQDRCGPGPRLPLLVISPYAKQNFVAHNRTEQAAVLRFIESNWNTKLVGDSSFDTRAGSIDSMFSFKHPTKKELLLNQNGSVIK
jgi:phospholipase C